MYPFVNSSNVSCYCLQEVDFSKKATKVTFDDDSD